MTFFELTVMGYTMPFLAISALVDLRLKPGWDRVRLAAGFNSSIAISRERAANVFRLDICAGDIDFGTRTSFVEVTPNAAT